MQGFIQRHDGKFGRVCLLTCWLQVILHDFKCKPVFDLGSGPYNVARWNPFGRFLAIAGFGNLPGTTWNCSLAVC
jgi:hypothetical protein